jgi:hypothetical protein
LAISLCAACARFKTVQDEVAPDGTRRHTQVTGTTFFDSKSQLANLKTTMTDKSQGTGIGSLSQEANGSNAVNLIEGATRGAVKGAMEAIGAAGKP